MTLQVGRILATVTGTRLVEARTGTPQVQIAFETDDGDAISAFRPCTEAAWEYTEQDLITCGWTPSEHDYEFDQLDAEPSPCKDTRVQLVLIEEEYEGRVRIKVGFINAPGGMRDPLEPEAAKALSDKIRSMVGVGKPSRTAKKKKTTTTKKKTTKSTNKKDNPPAADEDDGFYDIPF